MAAKYPSPLRMNPARQIPRPGGAKVYTPPATTQDAAKRTVGVYTRPERAFSGRAPLIVMALLLGVLVLLWMVGVFV